MSLMCCVVLCHTMNLSDAPADLMPSGDTIRSYVSTTPSCKLHEAERDCMNACNDADDDIVDKWTTESGTRDGTRGWEVPFPSGIGRSATHNS